MQGPDGDRAGSKVEIEVYSVKWMGTGFYLHVSISVNVAGIELRGC